MKKTILAIALLPIFFASCAPKFFALKGSYPQPPFTYHSDKSQEKVWDNLIDLFAQKGLSIKVIDRSSGLIVSEKSKLTWTSEDKNGRVKNPNAFVVLPIIKAINDDRNIEPYGVTGEWNVRIKKGESGTDINVNLLNFDADYGSRDSKYYLSYAAAKRKYQGSVDGITTGIFEKMIFEAIR